MAGVDDTPLIKAPATPRPPLAVRRQAPDSGRRLPPSEPVREPDPFEVFTSDDGLEPGLLPELEPAVPARSARSARPARPPAPRAITLEPAPVARRVWAAIVDGAILAGIDAVVLYLTLQLTGLPARERIMEVRTARGIASSKYPLASFETKRNLALVKMRD